MATVLKIKEFLSNLDNNDKIYVCYNDLSELECTFYTEKEIINLANEKDERSEIVDIDTALEFLEEYNFLTIIL